MRLKAKAGWAAAQGQKCVVVLSTELTDELIGEGYARDLVRYVQDQRKQLGCEYTDRIRVGVVTEEAALRTAFDAHRDYICQETLADELVFAALERVEPVELSIGDKTLRLDVQRRERN